jgi:hypothetical protein
MLHPGFVAPVVHPFGLNQRPYPSSLPKVSTNQLHDYHCYAANATHYLATQVFWGLRLRWDSRSLGSGIGKMSMVRRENFFMRNHFCPPPKSVKILRKASGRLAPVFCFRKLSPYPSLARLKRCI